MPDSEFGSEDEIKEARKLIRCAVKDIMLMGKRITSDDPLNRDSLQTLYKHLEPGHLPESVLYFINEFREEMIEKLMTYVMVSEVIDNVRMALRILNDCVTPKKYLRLSVTGKIQKHIIMDMIKKMYLEDIFCTYLHMDIRFKGFDKSPHKGEICEYVCNILEQGSKYTKEQFKVMAKTRSNTVRCVTFVTKYIDSSRQAIQFLSFMDSMIKYPVNAQIANNPSFCGFLNQLFKNVYKVKSFKIHAFTHFVLTFSRHGFTHYNLVKSALMSTLIKHLPECKSAPAARNIVTILYRITRSSEMGEKLAADNNNKLIAYYARNCTTDVIDDKHFIKLICIYNAMHKKVVWSSGLKQSFDSVEKAKVSKSKLEIHVSSDSEDDSADAPSDQDSDADDSSLASAMRLAPVLHQQNWDMSRLYSEYHVQPLETEELSGLIGVNYQLDKYSAYTLIRQSTRSYRYSAFIPLPSILCAPALALPPQQRIMPKNSVHRDKFLENLKSERSLKENLVVYDLGDKELLNEVDEKTEFLLTEPYNEPKAYSGVDHLVFDSRFENGNLQKAIQMSGLEYLLILTADVNTRAKFQWFYFAVSNMKRNLLYTFKIINMDRVPPQFTAHMNPLMFSEKEAYMGNIGWVRTGTNITYYQNQFCDGWSDKPYHTYTFTVRFQHSNDKCYFSYHFPYSYTNLLTHIWSIKKSLSDSIYFRAEKMCASLGGNDVPLLTITAPITENYKVRLEDRKLVVLSSRVHPCECNSSWVMDGSIDFLVGNSKEAEDLRNYFVFKIVPMINVDGVIHGNSRYSLSPEDQNRQYKDTNPHKSPEAYFLKHMVLYGTKNLNRTVSLFIDMHGHSRFHNCFLFGNATENSWNPSDKEIPQDKNEYMLYPRVLEKVSPLLAVKDCSFRIEAYKEGTARVCMWRQCGVKCCYTLETTYDCVGLKKKPEHITTAHLRALGAHLLQALWIMLNACRKEKKCIPFMGIDFREGNEDDPSLPKDLLPPLITEETDDTLIEPEPDFPKESVKKEDHFQLKLGPKTIQAMITPLDDEPKLNIADIRKVKAIKETLEGELGRCNFHVPEKPLLKQKPKDPMEILGMEAALLPEAMKSKPW